MEKVYTTNSSPLVPKCQCVTFEKSGRILGSCDSLFSVSGMSPRMSDKSFPFLKTIASELTKTAGDQDPLFYPGLDFNFSEYHSICDFTFMKTTDVFGAERFLWIIYDNSTHYRLLINKETKNVSGSKYMRNHAVTSTTFLKAG